MIYILMNFFLQFKEGWKLFKYSIYILYKKPIFLLPIFICWCLVATIILYSKYSDLFGVQSFLLGFSLLFLVLFLITFSISISNMLMLEFIAQIERGNKISFFKALKNLFGFKIIRAIPVIIIWTFIWFIILLLRRLNSRNNNNNNRNLSYENAARTLSGINNNPFSWLGLGLNLFEKLIRMVVFLALPAIVWEKKGSFSGLKKSLVIIRKHPVQFLTNYSLTEFFTIIVSLPLFVIFVYVKLGYEFSSFVWTLVILYTGMMWTFNIYLEQMSSGLLYLWHLKWFENGAYGDLSEIPKPNLLLKHPDLNLF